MITWPLLSLIVRDSFLTTRHLHPPVATFAPMIEGSSSKLSLSPPPSYFHFFAVDQLEQIIDAVHSYDFATTLLTKSHLLVRVFVVTR
jgi:hypothetical protein